MSESTDNSALTVTLKGGASFDAPWVVARGNSADEVEATLTDVANGTLLDTTAAVAVVFQGTYGKARGEAVPAAGAPARTAPAAGTPDVVVLNVPFSEKDTAKALGARFDKEAVNPVSGKAGAWIVKPRYEPDYLTKLAKYIPGA